MSDAHTITSRIHEKADKELIAAVSAACSDFRHSLSKLGVNCYDVRVPCHRTYLTDKDGRSLGTDGMADNVYQKLENILDCLPSAAFTQAADGNRTKALDAFMQRVDTLSNEVESLQQEVANVRQS